MNRYVCDRLAPETRTELVFEVWAWSGIDAARIADEVAYAAAWVEGTYHPKHRDHRAAPDQTSLGIAEGALGSVIPAALVASDVQMIVDSFGDLVLA